MTITPISPELEFLATLAVEVGSPTEVGESQFGHRRIIPLLGGTVKGPALNGRILPGGADFQSVHSGGYTNIHARYVIETDQGERIYVENTGIRTGSAEDIAAITRGEFVDPQRLYFRTYPRFETAAPNWQWLNRQLFVGTGARHPDRVELNFFAVR